MPDAATLDLWKQRAGMGGASLSLVNNDTMFANLEEEHNSDSEEELY